jgi:hypothetical protein
MHRSGFSTVDRSTTGRDARPSASQSTERLWNEHHAEASNGGAWTSALVAAAASLAVPTWLLGAGGELGTAPLPRVLEAVLVVLGAAALVCCARAAIGFGLAPRLRGSSHRLRLHAGAALATAGVLLFLQRAFWGGPELIFDPLALLGAVLPIFFLADLSRAMSVVAKGRHGTGIGAGACCTWLGAAALLSLTAIGWGFWWLPALVACGAAACSALAGARVWKHYEGDVVTG